jgi:hypothetical protein
MMQVIFVVIEYKISYCAVIQQLIEDNHWSLIFSILGKFFAWEILILW